MTTKFDPSKIIVLYNATPITAFAKGSFVEYEQKEDDWEIDVGADGEATFVAKSDKQGSAKITLKDATPSVLFLNTQIDLQNMSPIFVPGRLMIVDGNSGSQLFAGQAVIKKKPGKKYDENAPTVEYEFLYAKGTQIDGGSVVI